MSDSNTMDDSLMNFDLTPEKVKTNIKENAEYLQKIEKRELLEYIKNRIQRFAKNSSELKLKFNVEANKKALKDVIKLLRNKGWNIKYKKIRFEKVCGVWEISKNNAYTITIRL